MTRSVLLFALILLTGALLLIGGAANSLAANPTVDCTPGPDEIVCKIADSAGISAVRVTEPTSQGTNLAVDNAYSTCPAEVTVSWQPLVPNYELLISDCPGTREEIFTFNGLAHRPLGEATASLGRVSLVAGGFDREGDDGLQAEAGTASLWSALLLPEPATVGESAFEAAVFPLGTLKPSAEIQFSHYMTDVIVYLPDNSHDVMVYNGDMMAYGARDIPDGSSHVSLVEPFCHEALTLLECAPRLTYGLDPAAKGFYWEVSLPRPISVTVPTGEVAADRLRFATGASSRYPLHFHTVELRGTNLSRLTLYDALVRGPLPANTAFLPALRGGSELADPFGLEALTAYMESDPAVGDSLQVSDDLGVRVIGTGELVEELVEMPSGETPDDGVVDPVERPTPAMTQNLRVFNTGSLKEFEIEVSGELLEALARLVPGTGAELPLAAGLGVDGLLVRERRAPAGWSDGVDNRINLTGTTWWPWRTVVHFNNNCSGTLVGPRHILTAAHCINKRGTNQWYSFTATPGRNGDEKPYGDTVMGANPQPGDPFRWYFTPSGWRDPAYNDDNCEGSCFVASQWDWGLIIIPEYLGYQTGWMGYVARPAGQLNYQSHFNRGYPVCNSTKGNSPEECDYGELFGDIQTCDLGNYSYQGSDGWNRLIRNSCDLNGGHSGSAVYHYYYDPYLGKTVPVAAMVEIWEHCYQCSASDDTPNTARRLTPSSINTITFFRQWKP